MTTNNINEQINKFDVENEFEENVMYCRLPSKITQSFFLNVHINIVNSAIDL